MGTPTRKNIRLTGYDYSQSGAYFITICARNMEHQFGNMVEGKVELSNCGIIAERNIRSISEHMKSVCIDNYVVMPNHVHLILTIIPDAVGTRYIVSESEPRQHATTERTPYMASLQVKSKQIVPKTIQQYKASVTRDSGIAGLWQPRFHDHIIRDEAEYQRIWRYIDQNPANWESDRYHTQ